MTDETATQQSQTADSAPAARRSQRGALLVLGVIAVALVGFAVGFFVRPATQDSTPQPGAVDIGFSQDMTVHHNQAIEMASLALTNTTDGAVRNLAYDILTSQQNQVGQMQGWLAMWGEPSLPTGGYMGWMTGDSGHGGMTMAHSGPVSTMPGMASQAEIAQLRQARGQQLDVLFLQLMLRHHEGGLPMMQYAAQHADVEVVRQLAQTMVNTQQNEAKTMTEMLAARGAQPLPMN
ncbi:DUF305 domain-containing protein [Skermania sp. ID1734]|uniref:DUF305 domain-containing protein n=1 Tax=Skermania sp. ID1734 TaxID=2597516 RepID=UPI0011804B80|nr:DUF305 domain-containing protein [Skermania sp. ID1734]TSD93909.1 DUF305 domain-containing protein [Skermania sp. ID1734]